MDQIREAILGIVDHVAILDYLKREELEELLPFLQFKKYKKGETVFTEGEPGDFVCLISSGKMEIKKETDFKGKQVILAVLSKGSFVGELSIIDGKPRSATVVALEDSETLILKAAEFNVFAEKRPDIAIKFMRGIARVLSLRLRKLDDRLTAIF